MWFTTHTPIAYWQQTQGTTTHCNTLHSWRYTLTLTLMKVHTDLDTLEDLLGDPKLPTLCLRVNSAVFSMREAFVFLSSSLSLWSLSIHNSLWSSCFSWDWSLSSSSLILASFSLSEDSNCSIMAVVCWLWVGLREMALDLRPLLNFFFSLILQQQRDIPSYNCIANIFKMIWTTSTSTATFFVYSSQVSSTD